MLDKLKEHTEKDSRSDLDLIDSHVLIKKAQAGDFLSFQQLAVTFDSAVWHAALRIAGSVRIAEELYRRTFLRAFRNLAYFRFECSFSAWVFRELAKLCMEHLRQQSPKSNFPEERYLAGALILLTPRERMITELKFGQGFSLSLVAEILEIPMQAARLSLLRATGKLCVARRAELSRAAEQPYAEEVT